MAYHTKPMEKYAGYEKARRRAVKEARAYIARGSRDAILCSEEEYREGAAIESRPWSMRVAYLGMADGFREALNGR